MKKNMTNATHIEGLLYQHTLESKVTGEKSANPGTTYITGTIEIATDNNLTNIVPVHFTYVTATTSKGKANSTFTVLQKIIDGVIGSVMGGSKETAAKVRVDSAIGLNEFFSDRNGTEELVSAKRNEGGFIHVADALLEDEKQRNTFKVDMIINGVTRLEEDEERQIPERCVVKGYIFDFKKAILPVDFVVYSKGGMDYFESLTTPAFTTLWGNQISEVIKKEIREESAFGEDSVRVVQSSRKSFSITGTSKECYPWDDEEYISVKELNEAMANRETYLATLKQRSDEWKASQQAATNKAAIPAADASSNFRF